MTRKAIAAEKKRVMALRDGYLRVEDPSRREARRLAAGCLVRHRDLDELVVAMDAVERWQAKCADLLQRVSGPIEEASLP